MWEEVCVFCMKNYETEKDERGLGHGGLTLFWTPRTWSSEVVPVSAPEQEADRISGNSRKQVSPRIPGSFSCSGLSGLVRCSQERLRQVPESPEARKQGTCVQLKRNTADHDSFTTADSYLLKQSEAASRAESIFQVSSPPGGFLLRFHLVARDSPQEVQHTASWLGIQPKGALLFPHRTTVTSRALTLCRHRSKSLPRVS